MSKRTYVSSSSSPSTEPSWEEKCDDSYLLKDEVIKELQDALKEAKEAESAEDLKP